jgi:rubrerythrin
MAGPGKKATGTKDVVYNLVSIIYHALQGAETYALYVSDAEQAGDKELAQLFREVQQDEKARSDRAKELLAARLSG